MQYSGSDSIQKCRGDSQAEKSYSRMDLFEDLMGKVSPNYFSYEHKRVFDCFSTKRQLISTLHIEAVLIQNLFKERRSSLYFHRSLRSYGHDIPVLRVTALKNLVVKSEGPRARGSNVSRNKEREMKKVGVESVN